MMASKLIGTAVISANNESIGDVNDLILDAQGKATAVVIGVGGFLGIGEKDVAVPFDRLDLNPPQQAMGGSAGSSGGASSTSSSTSGSGTAAGASGSSTAGGNRSANREGGVPDRVMLRMTKAELQAAPSFRASGGNNSSAGGSSGTPAGSGSPASR